MKKLLLTGIISLITLTMGVNTPVFANDVTGGISAEVVTFVENQHQFNLGETQNFAVNNSDLYFNNGEFNKFNFETNQNSKLPYSNVTQIKQTQNFVVFLTDGNLKILKNGNEVNVDNFSVTCQIYNVYEKENCLFISYISNSTLNFVKINANLQIENQISKQISYENVVALCLNENYTFLITQTSNNFGFVKISNLTNSITPLGFNYLNCTQLEILEQNGETYFVLVSHLNQTLTILKENENELVLVSSKSTFGTTNPSFMLGEVSEFTDIKIYNNLIYVADNINKNIQSFSLLNENIVPNKIIVALTSFEDGYFNSVNDFQLLNDNALLVSDTNNNRLQKIENTQIETLSTINEEPINSPKFYSTFNNSDFWFYANSKLFKVNGNNFQNVEVGSSISALEIDANNNVYLIDHAQISLKIIKNNTLTPQVLKEELDVNENSKLQILSNNNFVISKDNTLTLTNSEFNTQNTLNLEDQILDVETDYYNNLYVLTTKNLIKVGTQNDTLKKIDTLNFNTTNFSSFEINKANGNIWCYDKVNECFVKIVCDGFVSNLNDFEHPFNTASFEPLNTIISSGNVLNDCYISNFPNNTDIKQQLAKNTTVFILSELDNCYYIMFNNNNQIDYGYITKENLQTKQYEILEPQKVIVINKNIKLYKLPTILHDLSNGFEQVNATLNEQLNVVNFNLDSIDNSEYYVVQTTNNEILYVNASDVALYGSSDIRPLPNLNAEIIVNDGTVKLYSAPTFNSTLITELNNKQKIYVPNFDSTKQFTYITVVTEDKQEIFGYVETKYIKLNEDNPNFTSAFVLLGVGILIIIISTIIFVRYKKRDDIKQ